MARGRKKGSPKVAGSGRKIGSPNLTTKIVREAAIMAAEIVGQDGRGKHGLVGYLINAARKNPVPFLSMLGRCIPVEVRGTVAQEIAEIRYETADEIREALRQQGIVVPEVYQLEYHDPSEVEAIEQSYEAIPSSETYS